MATTKICGIEGDIGHVIRYTENSAKIDLKLKLLGKKAENICKNGVFCLL